LVHKAAELFNLTFTGTRLSPGIAATEATCLSRPVCFRVPLPPRALQQQLAEPPIFITGSPAAH
jgi:hypothetical protein